MPPFLQKLSAYLVSASFCFLPREGGGSSGKRWRTTARQFGKFAVIGGLGFFVDYALLSFGINILGLGHKIAALFSFPFAVTFTWIGNRLFTFRDGPAMPAVRQWQRFAAVCAVGLIFNRGTFSLCDTYLPLANAYPIISLMAGSAAGMFFNFFATRRHVFGM